MATETPQAEPSQVNGGEPNDQEALLAAQVDTIGDDPQEEPAAAAAAVVPAIAEPAAEEAAATAAAAEAAATAATDAAAASTAAAVVPAAAEPAPVAPVVVPAPTSPKDFDAAFKENFRQHEDGEIETEAYQTALRNLTKEEATYTARLEIWNERQQSAAAAATQGFNDTAVSWEQQNAEFMANPLRAQQMQAAIVAVDTKTPGLSPAQLFEAAAKVAFEAFNWQPKTAATTVDVAAAEAAALAGRQPSGVPQTLASAAAAAPIENAATNSTFGTLDTKDISSLEDAVARMTKDQQDAYLRDSPGSSSPATNRQSGMG